MERRGKELVKGKHLAGQREGEGGKYLENTELILGFSIMVILTKKKLQLYVEAIIGESGGHSGGKQNRRDWSG